MIVKVLTPAFDVADSPSAVQDSKLVSLCNANNQAVKLLVGPGVFYVGPNERVVIEKAPEDIIDAPDVSSGVWVSGVAYKA